MHLLHPLVLLQICSQTLENPKTHLLHPLVLLLICLQILENPKMHLLHPPVLLLICSQILRRPRSHLLPLRLLLQVVYSQTWEIPKKRTRHLLLLPRRQAHQHLRHQHLLQPRISLHQSQRTLLPLLKSRTSLQRQAQLKPPEVSHQAWVPPQQVQHLQRSRASKTSQWTISLPGGRLIFRSIRKNSNSKHKR